MSLIMPDINLRRKRQSIENFWMRALQAEHNHHGDNTIAIKPEQLNQHHQIEPHHYKIIESSSRQTSSVHAIVPVLGDKTILLVKTPEMSSKRYHQVEPQQYKLTDSSSRQTNPNFPVHKFTLVKTPEQRKRYHQVEPQQYKITESSSRQTNPVQANVPVTSKPQGEISQSEPPTSSNNQEITPPSRYITRVHGPTLGFVLNRIHLNEGNVTVLDFSNLSSKNKRLEEHGSELVARVLMTNHTVKRVIMRDHAIGDVGAVALANTLRYNTTLEYIDLYGNNISDVGVDALAKALYGNESLTHLSLWSNVITNIGAKMLAAALKCNRRLRYLGLVHNRITKEGADALLDALEVNITLEGLNVATNRIPATTTSQIRTRLARNRAEAPKVLSMMRVEEEEVDQRIFELQSSKYMMNNQNESDDSDATYESDDEDINKEDVDYEDTCSETSGFMSCSDIEDDETEDSNVCAWL